ncbi:hypothetical protein [Ruminococcus sp.]
MMEIMQCGSSWDLMIKNGKFSENALTSALAFRCSFLLYARL